MMRELFALYQCILFLVVFCPVLLLPLLSMTSLSSLVTPTSTGLHRPVHSPEYAALLHLTHWSELWPKPSCGTCKNLKAKEEQHARAPPESNASRPALTTATWLPHPSTQMSDMQESEWNRRLIHVDYVIFIPVWVSYHRMSHLHECYYYVL